MTLPTTESIDPRMRDIDAWSTQTVLNALWEGQFAAVAALATALPAIATAVEAASARLSDSDGRLVYTGAGTSGRLAIQDGAELVPTFDWPPERLVFLMAGGMAALTTAVEGAEDDVAAGLDAAARAQLRSGDVVVALAASGATPFPRAVVRAARAAGALTIGVACSPAAPLLAEAEQPILVATGSEPIAGSTRMKAGTAQKIVLTLLSTTLMIRLGRVHRGLMVDMRARNDKLKHRAERMVADLTGARPDRIAASLASADGRVKTAVVMIERGLDATAADALLAAMGGSLRSALTADLSAMVKE